MKHKFLKISQNSAFIAVKYTGLFSLAVILTACNSTGPLFPSKKDLVSASDIKSVEYGAPLSAVNIFQNAEAHLTRKAGNVFVGRPYQIKGQWFYPKVEIGYSKVGRASWYGPGFHGRTTANGEIFDMNHLTAAHPTMPLPSYARVTNLRNGSSVIVRVNDRGPFAQNRLIDVSKKTAETLHFTDSGITDVKVDYLGPAPAQPRKDSYLLSSYRAPTKSSNIISVKDSGNTIDVKKSMNVLVNGRFDVSQTKPVIHDAPRLSSAYVNESVVSSQNNEIFAQILRDKIDQQYETHEFIALGSFASKSDADALGEKLKSFGLTQVSQDKDENGALIYSANLMVENNADEALKVARDAGARDAFIVRD